MIINLRNLLVLKVRNVSKKSPKYIFGGAMFLGLPMECVLYGIQLSQSSA